MPRIDFEAELNAGQLAAATAPDGPALVLAAAGTGKTRTLVYRVAHLVGLGVHPDRILLLTFTNRAAREMLERAAALVGGVSGIWGGTFHHMANRLLRRHAALLGYGTNYTILDRDDTVTLLRQAIDDLHFKGREFPRPGVLLSMLCTAANTETPLADTVEAWFADVGEYTPATPEEVLKVLRAYAARKRELDAMDFDDLLVNGLRLFREQEGLMQRYREQFQHVLVDEYQDTNPLQAEWVDRVAGAHRNLLVVGDDFQSIYSWRGADVRNIMTFKERYADAAVYLLETNYRSAPEILAVANSCIAASHNQYQKTLRATRDSRRRPVLARLRDGADQAMFVIHQIEHFRREGYEPREIAVLYRAHYHAMELQLQLARERIAYTITSGVRFFEQAHVKDVCSYLRLLQSPADEMAMARVLELLPGVGRRTSQRVWEKLERRFDIFDAPSRDRLAGLLPAGARDGWHEIVRHLPPDREHIAMAEAVADFVHSFYHTHAVDTFDNYRQRLDEIEAMGVFMQRYESVAQFLSDVALLSNLDAETDDVAGSGEGVRLSTVHQAKGLEWRVVILIWLADGMFPLSRSLGESGSGEDEERRLFYVAVTRARDDLVMCVPRARHLQDGGTMYCEQSRFLSEIDGDLYEEVLA